MTINAFSTAWNDVKYALELKPFLPDFDNIIKIIDELESGDILRPEEREVLVKIKEKINENKINFTNLFDSTKRFKGQDRTLMIEVLSALIQKYNDSNYDLQAIEAISHSLQKELLSATDGCELNKIVESAFFPFVRWGMRDPYTFTDQSLLGRLITVVKLPLGLRSEGVLAWACLAHEIGGHHFLSIFQDNLLTKKLYHHGIRKQFDNEFKSKIKDKYQKELLDFVVDYWKNCSLELACDVLGVRHLGPAFAVGNAGYFKSMSDELKASEFIYTKDKQPRQLLELTFPNRQTSLISDCHAMIQLPSSRGFFGKMISFSESGEDVFEGDIQFTKKRVHSEGHPLDILRLVAMRKLVGGIMEMQPKNTAFSDEKVALEVLDNLLTQFSRENEFLEFVEVDKKKTHKIPINLAFETAEYAAECVENGFIGWFQEMQVDSSRLIQWTALDTKVVKFVKEKLLDTKQKNIPRFPSEKFPSIDANSSVIRHIVAASIMLTIDPTIPVSRQFIFNKMKRWILDADQIVLHTIPE